MFVCHSPRKMMRQNHTIYGIPELYVDQNLKLPSSTNYIISRLNLVNIHISPSISRVSYLFSACPTTFSAAAFATRYIQLFIIYYNLR